MSAARTQRDRQAAAAERLDNAGPQTQDCAAALLVQTCVVTTYPTAAGAYYGCNPCQLSGLPLEGASATPIADTLTIVYAYNEGTQIPPVGTVLVAHGVGGRLVFRYDG
jgi:hypothetical protein